MVTKWHDVDKRMLGDAIPPTTPVSRKPVFKIAHFPAPSCTIYTKNKILYNRPNHKLIYTVNNSLEIKQNI
jgi:hypothetical protein